MWQHDTGKFRPLLWQKPIKFATLNLPVFVKVNWCSKSSRCHRSKKSSTMHTSWWLQNQLTWRDNREKSNCKMSNRGKRVYVINKTMQHWQSYTDRSCLYQCIISYSINRSPWVILQWSQTHLYFLSSPVKQINKIIDTSVYIIFIKFSTYRKIIYLKIKEKIV